MSAAGGLPDLPDLEIVPVEALFPHERVDAARAEPLMRRLQQEGVLRNPPVVIPAGDRSERFVVLDGANRTLALRRMQVPHILVQVAHAGASSVRLQTWNHVLLACGAAALLEAIESNPEIALIPSDPERADFTLSAGAALAYLTLADGQVREVVGETHPLEWRVRNLNRLVASYQGLCRVERVSTGPARGLAAVYPELAGLIVFRPFAVEEVVACALGGELLPAGLTRFVISPRALRLSYPLERLAANADLPAKRLALAEWLRARVGGRNVRYYAESTFLFDE